MMNGRMRSPAVSIFALFYFANRRMATMSALSRLRPWRTIGVESGALQRQRALPSRQIVRTLGGVHRLGWMTSGVVLDTRGPYSVVFSSRTSSARRRMRSRLRPCAVRDG
jgi:hypothetical protein